MLLEISPTLSKCLIAVFSFAIILIPALDVFKKENNKPWFKRTIPLIIFSFSLLAGIATYFGFLTETKPSNSITTNNYKYPDTVLKKDTQYIVDKTVNPILEVVDSTGLPSTPIVHKLINQDSIEFIIPVSSLNDGVAINTNLHTAIFALEKDTFRNFTKNYNKIIVNYNNTIGKKYGYSSTFFLYSKKLPDSLLLFVKIYYNAYDSKKKDGIGYFQPIFKQIYLFVNGNYDCHLQLLTKNRNVFIQYLKKNRYW